ncbi:MULTISPECIES: alginate lyase family protein [Streptomyces]|uniref:Alginate lyase n=1 Tax=Streptomyces chartreusis NRRL 3882 TaxID=1079985 RepID=A0A2N9B4F9_STRCX|nr:MULTISPECIES: alginate lyase family protein [Streptomyces]MYS95696.1 cell wall anchor protein [Streptomyces sp. SID5464]SOR78236.1 Alginate lyase [Streptomyces chartreusis NRRL 3882]
MSRTSPHAHHEGGRVSRRGLLKTAGGLTAALALGATATATTADAAPATFTHPGMLHNAGDINRAKVRVAAGDDPWASGWRRLTANSHSVSTWTPRPTATIIRGGTGENYPQLYNDIHAAYQNALRWHVGGTAANADCAVRILNAWSATLTSITGNADRYLAAGLYGWQFANVAELMRGYAGFDLGRFKTMMLNVFYPLNDRFLREHNDACITNYWANWDLCNMASIMAIGILCDDGAKYDQAVTYFKSGGGNGQIQRAVPFLYSGVEGYDLGQWQESGRDQGHTVMGMGQMGALCEMAWNQGDDLYSYDGRRFMKAAQYVAKYNLNMNVPYTTYTWGSGQNCSQQSQTVIGSGSRGQVRPVWAMLHYHYGRRLLLDDKYIAQMCFSVAPEGGGGDYGTTSGGFDQLGFGTLMYAK